MTYIEKEELTGKSYEIYLMSNEFQNYTSIPFPSTTTNKKSPWEPQSPGAFVLNGAQ
jgi:hypothetical protein